MVSNELDNAPGCANWMKWVIGTGIGLITAAGSAVAVLQYCAPQPMARVNQPVNDNTVVVTPTSVPVSNSQYISPEVWQAVQEFLNRAIVSEIAAYQYGDSSYAATMFYGDAMQSLQDQIADLNSRGIMMSARFDYDNSYIYDIRLLQNDRMEVDTCEYWSSDYYDRLTGALLSSESWTLVPQTILIEYLSAEFYITSVAFYTGQAFC